MVSAHKTTMQDLRMSDVVIDIGFGDSGKGRVVDWLSKHITQYNLNVRFSGTAQSAHRVVLDKDNNKSHIYHHFGSATHNGVPTYFSEHFIFNISSFISEYEDLINKKMIFGQFHSYFNKKCTMVTPYDIIANQLDNINLNHGTCGHGLNKTIKRQENGNISLFVLDIFNPTIFKIKLEMIKNYYNFNDSMFNIVNVKKEFDKFYRCVDLFRELDICIPIENIFQIESVHYNQLHKILFEGTQGVLLDKKIGFFPNVTNSNTDLTNVYEIINNVDYKYTYYFVTRAYQWRHGNGLMTNNPIETKANTKLHLCEDINNRNVIIELPQTEENITNEFQGNSRVSLLDLDLLKYSLQNISNYNYYFGSQINNVNLVVTCLDHFINNVYGLTMDNGRIYTYNNMYDFLNAIYLYLTKFININSIYYSDNDFGEIKLVSAFK